MATAHRKLMDAADDIATTISYISTANENVNSTAGVERTFSMSIGTADPNRVLVICVYQYNAVGNYSGATFGCTVDGNAATLIAQINTNTSRCLSIYAIAWPTGTTATIGISCSVVDSSRGVSVYRMLKSGSISATSTVTVNAASVNNISANLTGTVASGVVVASYGNLNGANPTNTAGGLTKDNAVDIRSNEWFAVFSKANSSSGTQTLTFNSSTTATQTFAAAHWA